MIADSAPAKQTGQDVPPAASFLPTLPWIDWLLLVVAGALVFGPVTITWNTNANYSFGWWIPAVAAFLFFERWAARPLRSPLRSKAPAIWAFGIVAVIYLAFRLAAEADPDWRPGLWVLALIYLAGLLGWLWLYGGVRWLRHFAFPVCFLLLGLPWFYEIEHPLTQDLMRMNTIMVAFSLQTMGIAADAAGNIIQLQNCQLGVEEACSGILSLQASLVMGLLLGEIYQLPLKKRFALIGVCIGAALVGNYLRTMFLAIMASLYGTGAVTEWHDTAGFSILILTALTGWIACLLLHSGEKARVIVPVKDSAPIFIPPARRLAVGVLAIVLGAEVLTQGWFFAKEASVERHPGWTVKMPDGSKKVDIPSVTLAVLMCDEWNSGAWQDLRGWQWNSMWFNYKPKPSNRVVMGWHTPENCLPSMGWQKDSNYDEFIASVNGIDLRVQPIKFLAGDAAVYVFWVVYPRSGRLPSKIDNESHAPVAAKFTKHLTDVWQGNRGVGVETLETTIVGPTSFDEARAAYLQNLRELVQASSPTF